MTDTYSNIYVSQSFSDAVYLTKPDVDAYGFDNSELSTKQSFDYASYGQVADILAPHPEQFESEIDSSLASFDAEVFGLPTSFVDNGDIFSLLRSDTPTRGVPSTFTVSSESASAYDSGYGDNLSSYNYSHSPSSQYSSSNYLTSEEIDMDFKRLGLLTADTSSSYSPPSEHSSPSSISLSSVSPPSYNRGSFSDYEPVNQIRVGSSSSSDYYPHMASARYAQSTAQATVAPTNVSTAAVSQPSAASVPKQDAGVVSDPKRKYPCPNCSRAFARQFNLKTHIQTHDPNRSKPYACHHKSCARAFSRKHDLQRHLISIHRAEVAPSTSSTESVGVGSGTRTRCNKCGRSWIGRGKESGCDCDDVK